MTYIRNRYEDELSSKERTLVYKVLEQYNFQVMSCTKIRNAYKIKTSKGNICLKKISQGHSRSNNGNFLTQKLLEQNFNNMVSYYRTKDGRSYVKHKKVLFYATEWIDGTEWNLDNIEAAVDSVKLLAQFHLAASNIDTNELKIKNNLKNWPKAFTESFHDIEKYERMINNKKIKSVFDLSYLNSLESIYYRGVTALKFLNTADFYKLYRWASRTKTLCFNDFYHKNIIKKEDMYYIVDLDDIVIDLHVNDLGKLISRLVFKNSFIWNFNKVKILIEAYTSINKLNKSELQVLLALIIFPYKFWKIGKKRYIKHKAWDESKYMNKLVKLTRYNDMQDKFLEDYVKYLNEL